MRSLFPRIGLSLLLCLVALSVCFAETSPDFLLIDNFETGLAPAWEVKSFVGQTEYRVIDCGEGHCLQAESNAAASGLFYEIDFDPRDYPILSWRWKIDQTIAKGNAQTKAGDDYAARIYVVFPHWFFPKTRTLNYIWANHLPQGEVLPNVYTENAVMFAVESGSENAGKWVAVRRNIVKDYRRAFGEDPPRVGAIAIMTDTDNTKGQALAWYDEIVISRE